MKPQLFSLLGIEVWSFPFFLVCGEIGGMALAVRGAPREGIDPLDVVGLTFWTFLFGLLGARIGWCLLFLEYYRAHPHLLLDFHDGGLSFYGGLLAALAVAWGYGRLRRLPLSRLLDLAAPSTAFALFIGSIGLLLSGSCYGKPCPPTSAFIFFAISFPPESLGRGGGPFYPTQPLLIAGNLLIFLDLHFRAYPRRLHDGEIFPRFLSLYALLRFLVALIEDSPQGGIGPLSDTAILSLMIFLLARLWRALLLSKRNTQPWREMPL